jgi:hypothetical protein
LTERGWPSAVATPQWGIATLLVSPAHSERFSRRRELSTGGDLDTRYAALPAVLGASMMRI